MLLTNEITVPVPADRAWRLLTDVERVALCVPGAELVAVEGDTFTGVLTLKVGPITAQYRGTARFTELDAGERRMVLSGHGGDVRGQGTAAVRITMTLAPGVADATVLRLETDLELTGRIAQFGRGVVEQVGDRLVAQFADRLRAELAGTAAPAPAVLDAGALVAATPMARALTAAGALTLAVLLGIMLSRAERWLRR
ncbi:SRPBCC family protein [Nonomuraea sp. NPDC050451]|uniref:SRPBCC family protein n=1 Tax=Nonomuraea sp. NPDC050451 TaxID=3364364 RepID=UPI00379C11E1